MELSDYAGMLRGELAAITRFASDDVARAGQMLAEALDSSVRLTLLDVLSAAAAEITAHLDDTVVEVRLAGGEPSFVVTSAQPDPLPEAPGPAESADETGTARITLRLSDALKVRVETAAADDGVSVNAWLVRATARALDGPGPAASPRSRRGVGQRITGYARS
ncbi:MAG: histidine kinase [Streptosporangiaceae bacterium]